ncbi:MAG TPA: metalloprotease, partial [Planctomycetes bacterium]|nr:metalloprotease [Planctomycetota bacterium]
FWHTRWQPQYDYMPHHVTIDIGSEALLGGVIYVPRQDQTNGRVARVDVFCSLDGVAWGEPAASAHWGNSSETQRLAFETPRRARYLKFVARSEVNGNPFAAAAELDIVPAEK